MAALRNSSGFRIGMACSSIKKGIWPLGKDARMPWDALLLLGAMALVDQQKP
jgi:hypothetical protein